MITYLMPVFTARLQASRTGSESLLFHAISSIVFTYSRYSMHICRKNESVNDYLNIHSTNVYESLHCARIE